MSIQAVMPTQADPAKDQSHVLDWVVQPAHQAKPHKAAQAKPESTA
jgi:hypothetical protein